MATLRNNTTSSLIPCRCLVGRSSLADLILGSRRASNEHASIGWYENGWFVRDLGSSNGTLVDGKLLNPRERVALRAGNTVQFGSEADTWEVVDVSAPAPVAVQLGAQRLVWGQRSLLVLPDEAAPQASIYFNDGAWHVDDGAVTISPDCGDIIELPSGYWRLLLPDAPDTSGFTAGYQLDLGKLELVFHVGGDNLRVRLVQGTNETELPARACLQTLHLLAQIRQQGPGQGGGWIGTADLASMRACTPEKINVDVHRLRRLFEDAGVHDAARIVERDGTKRLRIGVERTAESR
jgi:FHA domain